MMKFEEHCKRFDWETWTYPPGKIESLKKANKRIRPDHGVYIIRAQQLLGRAGGSSNVVYIGQAGGKPKGGKQGIGKGNGCPGRLFNTRGADKIIRLLIEEKHACSEFRVECYFTKPDVDPRHLEMDLINSYVMEFLELPPANHNRSIPGQVIKD